MDGGVAYGLVSDWAASLTQERTKLTSVRLDPLDVLAQQPIGSGSASLLAAMAGKIFLQTAWPSQELLVYAAGASGPTFEGAFPAPGWPSDVTVAGGNAYVASGPWGVTVVPLDGVSSTP